MSKQIFLDALDRKKTHSPTSNNSENVRPHRRATGPGTSIVSMELMDHLGVHFPGAHLDPEQMTALALAGHTEYGFDVVMPLFSVWHESAALGCNVDWGRVDMMPDCSTPLWKTDEDIRVPPTFLSESGCKIPLDAIGLLKKRIGDNAAVCGKVFGPWTLGYHVFGVQEFLINTLLQPDMIKRSMEKLVQVTIDFANAQIDAGADCLLLGDHATRDLCSPNAYTEFLSETHARLANEISVPLILHICGDTSDRIHSIANTGIACFHWDTKLGSSQSARELAGKDLSLMGGISNPEVLATPGNRERIESQVRMAIEADIDIIAPECAVSLGTPMENMKAIGNAVGKFTR